MDKLKLPDALKDSWAYKDIWQQGYYQGIEDAIRHPGLPALLRQRELLEQFVKSRIPNLLDMAIARGNAINDPDVLQEIILELINVEADFRALMEEAPRQILSK